MGFCSGGYTYLCDEYSQDIPVRLVCGLYECKYVPECVCDREDNVASTEYALQLTHEWVFRG